MTFDAAEHPRDTAGQFTEKTQSAPEATLAEKPLTEDIATYLREYDEQSEAYAEDGGGYGPDADAAYEAWEDFQTGTSGRTYAMLEAAKSEIERLQAALAASEQETEARVLARFNVPLKLVEKIEEDFTTDEPLVYVPADGHQDGYVDAIATDGESTIKYTLSPEGDITTNACT